MSARRQVRRLLFFRRTYTGCYGAGDTLMILGTYTSACVPRRLKSYSLHNLPSSPVLPRQTRDTPSPKFIAGIAKNLLVRRRPGRQHVAGTVVIKWDACNLHPHSTTTRMLENGADIRHFQEMQGLADTISTRSTPIAAESLKSFRQITPSGSRVGGGMKRRSHWRGWNSSVIRSYPSFLP